MSFAHDFQAGKTKNAGEQVPTQQYQLHYQLLMVEKFKLLPLRVIRYVSQINFLSLHRSVLVLRARLRDGSFLAIKLRARNRAILGGKV